MNSVVDVDPRHASTGLLHPDRTTTLIDDLLAEQRQLTAVESFSRLHDQLPGGGSGRYQSLLPTTPPGPGQQYAFEVDLDRCSGCKACVTACHSLNGLDDDETWRSVGLLIAPAHDATPSFQQHVTTACHHCVDPGCLNGCPVLAYDKDPETGIVRHLDDQCMGCSYCVMKCPYEVPRYSQRLGIVRKCDLCQNRLAVGEAPACAQACPNEAIRITIIDQESVRKRYSTDSPILQQNAAPALSPSVLAEANSDSHRSRENAGPNGFLADSPDPGLTLPSTRYLSIRPYVEQQAADREHLRLDPAHGPLVAMLLLTQASAGLWLASAVTGVWGGANHFKALNSGALVLLATGLSASVFHLGRPSKAWRAFLGWRRSWLSREIIAFQAGAMISVVAAATTWTVTSSALILAATAAAAIMGLVGVMASSMVYIDTGRPIWSARHSLGNFFGTTLLLGFAFAGATVAWMNWAGFGQSAEVGLIAVLMATFIRTALFCWRRWEMNQALNNAQSPIHWNARVIRNLLPATQRWRTALFVVSTAAGLIALAGPREWSHLWASLSALSTLVSECVARHVYFIAGGARRMPGGLPT